MTTQADAARRRARQRLVSTLLVLGFLALVVTLVVGALIATAVYSRLNRKPQRLAGWPPDPRAAYAAAAEEKADAVADSQAGRQAIARFFDELPEGVRIPLDDDRILLGYKTAGVLPRLSRVPVRFEMTLGDLTVCEVTTTSEVRDVRFLERRGEAVALVRHRLGDGSHLVIRWWLRKSGGRWQIYDYQRLHGYVRATLLAVAQDGSGPEPADSDEQRRAAAVVWAADLIERPPRKLASVEELLRAAPPAPSRADLEAARWLMLSEIDLAHDRHEDALEKLDRAEAADPGMPKLHFNRAVVFNQMGRHEQAREHAQAFIDLVGGDADGYYQLGLALEGLQLTEEAAEAFRKGVAEDPGSQQNRDALERMTPDQP